jgi:hypothetical protein
VLAVDEMVVVYVRCASFSPCAAGGVVTPDVTTSEQLTPGSIFAVVVVNVSVAVAPEPEPAAEKPAPSHPVTCNTSSVPNEKCGNAKAIASPTANNVLDSEKANVNSQAVPAIDDDNTRLVPITPG